MKKILFLFIPFFLYAHQTGLSFLDIDEKAPSNILLNYKKPLSDTRKGDISIEFPSDCFFLHPYTTKISNGFIIKQTTMQCTQTLKGKTIWVKGLVKNDRGILIYYKNNDFEKKSILRSTSPFIKLDLKTQRSTLVFEYIYLGITHILMGYDHLMFVLLLVLLAKNIRQLLFTITAFTLSHSITLTCSVLDIFYLPPPFVEMMIALSIIFLAKEILIKKETFTKRYLPISSFSFGLLHGFGFSSALKDIGLPQDDIPLALFSFNVGIEVGQILFIVFIFFIDFLLKKIDFSLFQKKHKLALYIGILAAFWFWQRFIPILTF